jgi:hypothetical protein
MLQRNILICLIFSLPFFTISQTEKDIDELCLAICNSIQNSKAYSDEEKVTEAFEEHIIAFIEFHELTVVDDLLDKVYFRLQKLCRIFSEMLTNANQSLENGDWEIIDKRPEIVITKKEARSFVKEKSLYYFETNRDKTFVTVKSGKWVETFADGTQSSLKFKWTGDTSFDLIFIESNNLTRKNFSNPGDIYSYTLISKEDGFYYFAAEVKEGDDRLLLSKFHYR